MGNVGPRDNCRSTYVRLGDNALYVVGACRGPVEWGGGRGGEGRIWAVQPRPDFFRSGWLEGFKTIGGKGAGGAVSAIPPPGDLLSGTLGIRTALCTGCSCNERLEHLLTHLEYIYIYIKVGKAKVLEGIVY